jgi:hypothetical protein
MVKFLQDTCPCMTQQTLYWCSKNGLKESANIKTKCVIYSNLLSYSKAPVMYNPFYPFFHSATNPNPIPSRSPKKTKSVSTPHKDPASVPATSTQQPGATSATHESHVTHQDVPAR